MRDQVKLPPPRVFQNQSDHRGEEMSPRYGQYAAPRSFFPKPQYKTLHHFPLLSFIIVAVLQAT